MTAAPGRLESALRAGRDAGRALLVPYVMGGVTPAWTDHLRACADAGADAVEIGLPFSDPVLDGPVVQRAGELALARGVTPQAVLAEVEPVLARLPVPALVMTYANLVLRDGAAAFCRRLAEAGVSGLIATDVPLEELDEVEGAARDAGIELVLLVSPATGPDRLRDLCRRSRGFVYAVSTMGTTGERDGLDPAAARVAAAARAASDLPVLVGFGISSPAGAVEAARVADGVVIGSAVMRRVIDGASPEDLVGHLRAVRRALDHQRQETPCDHGSRSTGRSPRT